MEDDDDFGDLYSDIPAPLPPQSLTLTAASGDRIPLPNPNPPQTLAPSPNHDPNDDWLPDNWNDDDDEKEEKKEKIPEPRVSEGFGASQFGIDPDPVIPGLSSGAAPVEPSEDWDSDSDDDLQIVLNDSNHHQHGMMMMGDGEDGDEDLVIVADGEQGMEETDWGEMPSAAAAGEGERKEGADPTKANGGAGGAVGAAGRGGFAAAHGFHPQHNSMYKYVRPGAPVAGAPGAPGQMRPQLPLGPIAGRGRGDWRPPGIRGTVNAQKSFNSGYPVPAWGNNSSGRGFGGGLDFTLPSHKTVFEVDLESFPEKPWRHPGVDLSDYFNFGLDEDSWKGYNKQLDQLRIESTMQGKIRVYESGRSEQEYDPDLPPELAVAAGHHGISTDNIHYRKIENGQVDIGGQGTGAQFIQPQLPQGRPIQVETGYCERLPSADTRPPRARDLDAIIEIVLQGSMDNSAVQDETLVQTENDIQGEHLKDPNDVERGRGGDSEYTEQFSPSIDDRKRERVNRRMPVEAEEDAFQSFPSDSPHYHPNSRLRSPQNPGGPAGVRHGGRVRQGTSRGRYSTNSGVNSNDVTASRSAHVKNRDSYQKQKSRESAEGNHTPEISADIEGENAKELSTENKDEDLGDKLALGDNVDVEGEENSDFRNSGGMAEHRVAHTSRKQKLPSQVENVLQDNGDDVDLRATRSDNSRAKSGSSKEHQQQRDNSEEVVQDGLPRRAREFRRRQEEENVNRGKDDYGQDRFDMEWGRMALRGREPVHNSHPYRHRELAHTSRVRTEGFERPREPDNLFWQRREEDINRRVQDEYARKDRLDETGLRNRNKVRGSNRMEIDNDIHTRKRVDDMDWRGHQREGGPREREKNDVSINRRDNFDENPAKRKKDVDNLRRERTADREDSLHSYRGREDSSRRRERDDVVDSRTRGKPVDPKGNREREDKQRLKLSHEESPVHLEREEGRGRSGRLIEDKTLGGNGRSKTDSKGIASDKDYMHKSKRRHGDQATKEEHAGEETSHARERKHNNEGRSSRHERSSTHSDRPTSASDNHHVSRERLKEGTRKSKDTEGSAQTSQTLGKRKHEDRSTQQTEKVKSRGTNVQDASRKAQSVHSSERHGEDIASDDENQQESKKGRSKLERWTSHKERDFSITSIPPTLLSTVEEVEAPENDPVPTDELPKLEDNNVISQESKGPDDGETTEKQGDDRDRHLDTVAKLKKRSERFKLPMPGEKDMSTSKKPDNESNVAPVEAVFADTEVKPERPARKRRWTGS